MKKNKKKDFFVIKCILWYSIMDSQTIVMCSISFPTIIWGKLNPDEGYDWQILTCSIPDETDGRVIILNFLFFLAFNILTRAWIYDQK